MLKWKDIYVIGEFAGYRWIIQNQWHPVASYGFDFIGFRLDGRVLKFGLIGFVIAIRKTDG
jgi:hypothetical protein